jgi:tRNA(fMet)-specific endonuclease VapC
VSAGFLLDTNIVSEPLRPEPSRRILRNLKRHEDVIAIASVVWHELRFGVESLPASRRRTRIEQYLDDVIAATMPILDYDSRAAEWHAAERARLAGRGESPPFVDGQIAAIAYVNDRTLVTLNDAHFKRFHGLRVVTWR